MSVGLWKMDKIAKLGTGKGYGTHCTQFRVHAEGLDHKITIISTPIVYTMSGNLGEPGHAHGKSEI